MTGTQPRRPGPLKRASVAGAVLTYGLLLSYCAALYVLVLAIGGVNASALVSWAMITFAQ